MSDSGHLIPAANPVTTVDRYDTEVPGKLKWFEPGAKEYQDWVSQRATFIGEIDPEGESGRAILNDMLDTILDSEVPTGLMGALTTFVKATKTARTLHKRRKIWYKVVDAVLQMTFTAPTVLEDEFVLSFHQVQHLWRTFGGGTLSPDDYKKLYSTIDTKLRVGKLRNRIIRFPELDRYVGYKLRQFKDSFHRYQFSLVEY
jgi:hypothetical protein